MTFLSLWLWEALVLCQEDCITKYEENTIVSISINCQNKFSETQYSVFSAILMLMHSLKRNGNTAGSELAIIQGKQGRLPEKYLKLKGIKKPYN